LKGLFPPKAPKWGKRPSFSWGNRLKE
jgi:hypothetical protein